MFLHRHRLLATCLLIAVICGSNAGAQQNCEPLINTLGTFSTSSQFSVLGSGALSVTDFQAIGPRLILTRPMVITEIGAIANSTLPLIVQIRPSLDGAPDPSVVLASFPLSIDGDPTVFSYEFVEPNLILSTGTYFALFVPQPGDSGAILQTHPPFQAEPFPAGVLNIITGESRFSEGEVGAVRILGCEQIGPPATKADCKNGGWRRFNFPRSFKNQGDCIQFVNTGR